MPQIRTEAGRLFDIAVILYNSAQFNSAKEQFERALLAAKRDNRDGLQGLIVSYIIKCKKNMEK